MKLKGLLLLTIVAMVLSLSCTRYYAAHTRLPDSQKDAWFIKGKSLGGDQELYYCTQKSAGPICFKAKFYEYKYKQ